MKTDEKAQELGRNLRSLVAHHLYWQNTAVPKSDRQSGGAER